MSSRKFDEAPEITAQPRQVSDALVSATIAESGLSIDPEDLGKQFLSEAMDQSNFESMQGGESSEVYPTGGALTDEALTAAAWEAGGLWEHTVNLSLQSGGLDEARGDDPIEALAEDDEKKAQAEHEQEHEMDDVDVTSSTIHNASLMDYETDELGVVASPRVDTDEQADIERRRAAAMEALESTLPTGSVRLGSAGRAASPR